MANYKKQIGSLKSGLLSPQHHIRRNRQRFAFLLSEDGAMTPSAPDFNVLALAMYEHALTQALEEVTHQSDQRHLPEHLASLREARNLYEEARRQGRKG